MCQLIRSDDELVYSLSVAFLEENVSPRTARLTEIGPCSVTKVLYDRHIQGRSSYWSTREIAWRMTYLWSK
jgi:hypothetical protein